MRAFSLADSIGTSKTGDLVNVREWVATHIPPERPVVFVLGAMAHGKVPHWLGLLLSCAFCSSVFGGGVCVCL
jgi:hypothetical protein